MTNEFCVVLPSNSSMAQFSENRTTHFVTQLPRQIRFSGTWRVALIEIQISMNFQHVSNDDDEYCEWRFIFIR